MGDGSVEDSGHGLSANDTSFDKEGRNGGTGATRLGKTFRHFRS